jgi:hypothetical protein
VRDRLLVRHFLLRFLDHDLVSPHADRREILTVACAMVVVSSLFLSFFLAIKYQFNLFLPPGLTSIFALDDRFFLFSLAMIVMALLAVAEWDALALDARDAAVLGPLPLPAAVIVRAKFVAIALFALAFDVGLSVGPTALRALALPVRLPITMSGALRLALAHAVCAIAAGAFGFTAVLGFRELCRAAVGSVVFRRISAALQATLVVLLLTALLLLPGSYSQVALRWMTHSRVPPIAVPPLWFVGLHETLAGRVIDGLARGTPPRRYAAAEREATALYRSLWPQFHGLATAAIVGGLALVLATAAVCAWNHRRLPSETVGRSNRINPFAGMLAWIIPRVVVRSPIGQAGFFFTFQTLTRSASHRVTLAAFVAVAFSIALITLNAVGLREVLAPASAPVSLFALQTLLVGVLLTGYRHLVRVPADPRAGWAFQLAWSGDDRRFVEGSKRAALALLAAPAVLAVCVLDVLVFPARIAAMHAAVGAAVSGLLVTILFLNYRKVPFATGYAGAGDLKAVVPLYSIALLAGATILAAVERTVAGDPRSELALAAVLLACFAALKAVQARRRPLAAPIDFDELPGGATQRFELTR